MFIVTAIGVCQVFVTISDKKCLLEVVTILADARNACLMFCVGHTFPVYILVIIMIKVTAPIFVNFDFINEASATQRLNRLYYRWRIAGPDYIDIITIFITNVVLLFENVQFHFQVVELFQSGRRVGQFCIFRRIEDAQHRRIIFYRCVNVTCCAFFVFLIELAQARLLRGGRRGRCQTIRVGINRFGERVVVKVFGQCLIVIVWQIYLVQFYLKKKTR